MKKRKNTVSKCWQTEGAGQGDGIHVGVLDCEFPKMIYTSFVTFLDEVPRAWLYKSYAIGERDSNPISSAKLSKATRTPKKGYGFFPTGDEGFSISPKC